MDTKTIVAKNLDALMAFNGDNQSTLARKTGLSQTAIGKILREEISPTVETLAKITSHYHKSNGYLLNEQNEEASSDKFLINVLIEGQKHLNQDTRFEYINRFALEAVMNGIEGLTDKQLNMLLSTAMAEKVRRQESGV